MIRTFSRDPGAELIVDTPSMANNEHANGGTTYFATAGWYDGSFQVYVEFEGANDLGVCSVTHRDEVEGQNGWSKAVKTVVHGGEQLFHIDPGVQSTTSVYIGKYGVEELGVQDPRIPTFMSPEAVALNELLKSQN